MVVKEAVVKSKHGLHARPSAKICEYAKTLTNTRVEVFDPETDKIADARSILTLLEMGKQTGSRLQVKASGEQETEAAEVIAKIINEFDV